MLCDESKRRSLRRGVRGAGVVVALSALTALAACTSGGSTGGQNPSAGGGGNPTTGSSTPAPETSAPATPAIITTSALTSTKISPSAPVTVSIAHGTLTAVTMTNAAGVKVAGSYSADKVSWHNTEDLGYSKTYKITATGTNAEGTAVVKHQSVTTVTPDNQTAVSMDRTGDYPLNNGAVYGVALVPEFYFDEDISSAAGKAAVQKAITVTTTPHVDGAFAWQDDNRVLWRPENYWPANTKVTVSANIYGVNLGNGLYGQSDEERTFTIGRKQTTVAVDSAPKAVNKVRVYNAAGKVIKTMNTAMGMHSGTYANGQYINFYTLGGTYTVLDHEQPAKMCSASYGLPANAPGGYACEDIYNATKISVDGIYLHYLDTFYAQNNGIDVSHGCLNLNEDNSMWFFKHSIVGDPVKIIGAKGAPTLKVWQGGAWTVPWSTWVKGDLSNS